MWKTLSIVLLCCSSLPAWAFDPWCSPRGKQAYRFEWVVKGKAEDLDGSFVGEVRIRNASGKLVQVLGNVSNYYGEDSEWLPGARDYNNDGCPDLVMTSQVAGIGNASVEAYLYNPRRRRFELNEALSNIGGLDVDPRDKNCVTGGWKSGADSVYASRHCWKKGKLVLVSEYKISPRYKEGSESFCYEHIETTYRGGRKRTRTKCTKTFE
ncbi:hypothetical protein G4G28_18240 [Massilia sp. Dwa41.01b]|uniref:XAC2610-related protein n=1 Tax=unclassified Massilia TaxID=2609279 RepID=UPI0016003601|nr:MULTISPECIES: hypothetical protein [unclassified Massilia]QNA89951.1 hypothetical protein G4G28_18240 [Massilia sp. Dwa41.01b]QNB00835.1 hypothetical protein G4G31_21805 [Massilia sp. Se16.2.3]